MGRSRGGLTTKIHHAVDGRGRPLATIVTVVTGADYVLKAAQLRRDSLAAGKPVDNS